MCTTYGDFVTFVDGVMRKLMTPPEKRPKLDSSLPRLSSSEEIATASGTPAQTLCRPIAILLFQLIGDFFCDDIRLIIIDVVERQFCPGCDRLGREEGEIVDIDIGMVVRDCVDSAVRITGVVDEPGRAPQMHAVTHVLGTSVLLAPLIEFHEVDFLVQCSCLAATVGFVMRDDLATVGVDELAPL